MKRLVFIYTFLLIALTSINVNALTKYDKDSWESSKYLDTYNIISVWDDNGLSDDNISTIETILTDIEFTFSRTAPESELYNVNQNAGIQPVVVSEELFNIIKKSITYAEMTEGKFDPTVGALVDLWKINPNNIDFRPPSDEKIQAAGSLLGYDKIVLNEEDKSVYLPEEGMVLDLGGIAKGYAADRIKEYLVGEGFKHAIINLGGNVLTIGNRYTQTEGWRISIRDPEGYANEWYGIIEVTEETIVSSGIYERYNWYNNTRYHHIIDTESFAPVINDLYCVTIVTDSSADADALSTGVFALGVIDGLELVESLDGVEAIFVTKDHKVITSSGYVNSDKFKLDTYYTDAYEIISLEKYKETDHPTEEPDNPDQPIDNDSFWDQFKVPIIIIGSILIVIPLGYYIYKKK